MVYASVLAVNVDTSRVRFLCINLKKRDMKIFNIHVHEVLKAIDSKFLIVALLLFPCFIQGQNNIVMYSGRSLESFIAAEQQGSLLAYESMVQIFTSSSLRYDKLCKAIQGDIRSCRRFIRKNKFKKDETISKQVFEYNRLLEQLRSFYRYVKEYKECCKAIQFHEQLRQRHQLAFNNPNIVQCVESAPQLYGVERSKYKCRAYFSKIAADLRKVDKFEDTIHGDHGLLKAHNYVYKIELIRVRNYVYHNNIYKFETRYF